ncbi:MAG: OmpA family protein [Alphaproteobacteria bacterium]|nr:OmpA family protein [Alphaproteobacteria bacterium]
MITIARSTKLLTGMGLAAFVLAGCVGQQLQVAEDTTPGGGAFDKALFAQYLKLAKTEYSEADYDDSDTFANRAILSAEGTPPTPEMVDSRLIPPQFVGELKAGLRKLNEVLDVGSVRYPRTAAKAQAAFDCWMQEQEENLQPGHIAKCKGDFNSAYNALKTALAPQPKAKKVVAAAKGKKYENFTVLFSHDSSVIDKKAGNKINKAVMAVDTTAPKSVTVSGYADRSGNADYNMTLSGNRAGAVAWMLQDNASTSLKGKVTINVYGEKSNKVLTANGKREPKNRRVKIEIFR